MSTLLPVPSGTIAAIVTYVEMTRRPPVLPDRPYPNLTVRQAQRPDMTWYRKLYARVGAEWLWFSRAIMSDAQLSSIIHHPNVSVYTVQQDGLDIGLLELDWRQAPECEVAFFGLVPEATGSGIGKWLMGEAQRIAFDEEQATRLWLHTCTLDHPDALPFYLRQGFCAYKREVEIAPDPRLTGDLRADAAPFHPIIGTEFDRGSD